MNTPAPASNVHFGLQDRVCIVTGAARFCPTPECPHRDSLSPQWGEGWGEG